jgi:hypothetical protein
VELQPDGKGSARAAQQCGSPCGSMEEPGTDGTFPWFFLTPGPPGPTPKPCQASSTQTTPTASRKSFIPWSLVPGP